jgi:AraC-like DNA-binding protein
MLAAEGSDIVMPSVQHIRLDTSDVPPEHRFATWAAAVPTYDASLPKNVRPEQFSAEATAWFLDGLVVTRSILSPVRLARTEVLIRRDHVDTYNFVLLVRGCWNGRTEGRELEVGPGQLVCLDLSQPFEVESGAADCIVILATRHAVDDLASGDLDLHGHVFSGGSAAILVGHLLALIRNLPEMEAEEAPAVARAVLGSIAAAVQTATRPDPQDRRDSSVRYRARRFIDAQLNSPSLTPDAVAEALGVARSTLYRSFKSHGGISAYMQRRRLEAAYALLADPAERRPIAEIAEAFGFTSAAHFTTAFKAAFALTPGQARASGHAVDPGSATDFHSAVSRL